MVGQQMDPATTPARYWVAYAVERERAEREQQQEQATEPGNQDIQVLGDGA